MGRGEEDLEMDDFDENKSMVLDEDSPSTSKKDVKFDKKSLAMGSSYDDRRMRRAKKHLPPALQGLMGQANLCFARGETELAERFCLQIIKEVSLASEPYLTLAQIYENKDVEKYTQFSLIAAHLNPGDVDQWVRVAESLVEQGNIKKAITCFTKAIKADTRNLSIRMRRIELLESIGEEKYAFRCHAALIPHVPPEQGEFLITIAKKVAQKYHEEGNITNALNAMESAYSKVSSLFTVEDINLLLELFIETGNYKKAIDVLCAHTGVKVKYRVCGTEFQVESITCLEELILDFRTKLIVAMVHLKCFSWLDFLIKNFFEQVNIEEAGDCYLDIAEALMKEERYDYALKLLTPLVKSQHYSLAAVWLRHADCHRALGNVKEAITSYRCVTDLAQHFGARLTLAALLKQSGEFDEALVALQQNPDTEIIDPGLLYERVLLLKEVGRREEFVKEGFLLISRHCYKIRNRNEMLTMCPPRYSNRMAALRELRETQCEPLEDLDAPEFFSQSELELTTDQEWKLFIDVLKTCYQIKQYKMFQRIVFTIMSSKKMSSNQKELETLALLSCVYARDYQLGYTLIREILMRDIKNKRLWNIFNQLLFFADDIRHIRFVNRIFSKNQVPPMAHLIQGNNYLMSGTYKYALNDYVTLFKDIRDPLLPLLISVTLTNIASQKYSTRKQSIMTQAIAYMEEYRKMREPEATQEVYYNFGRMYHQLGLLTLALSNYEKALATENEINKTYPEYTSLKAEIAYNIHLIHKTSGNYFLARKYLYDYIVV